MAIIAAVSVLAIAYSSRAFSEKLDDTKLSLGYLMPLAWFLLQLDIMTDMSIAYKIVSYLVIAGAYFWSWHYVRSLGHSRYQHIAAYVGGVIAVVFAISNIFGPSVNMYSSIFIAYAGIAFAFWDSFQQKKGERILTAIFLTLYGGLMALYYRYSGVAPAGNITLFSEHPSILAIIALIPAVLLLPVAGKQNTTPESVKRYLAWHSGIALLLAILIAITEIVQTFDPWFLFFILPGFFLILIPSYKGLDKNPELQSYIHVGIIVLSIGFFFNFFYFVANLAPHVADGTYFFRNFEGLKNWNVINAIFAIAGYFIALNTERKYAQNPTFQPSFLLVTIAYASLLLLVNFIIITVCNDMGIATGTGGVRAIGTTFWWILLAIFMLMMGIKNGKLFKTEKLLGLILLLLTVAKILVYDLATMEMNKKIIVLMIVGGLIMVFSYLLHSKGYLKDAPETKNTNNTPQE